MTPYHRLARESPDFEHWRLPVAALIGVTIYGVVSLVIVGVAAGLVLASGVDVENWLTSASSSVTPDDPGILVFQLLSIAALLPCVLGPVALFWRRHVGYLHSVRGRVRWGWLGHCVAVAFAVVAASLAITVIVGAVNDGGSVGFEVPDGRALLALLVIVVLVPFQSAAEEYVFRGGLLQLIGSWTRWTAIPVVATSLLFAAGHLYNLWGLVSVFAFGVVAALVTIRTGGLEAAIGLHVANNVVLMALDVVGVIDSSGEGAGLWNEVVPTVAMCLVYWALIERSARRRDLQRKRRPLAQPAPPTPTYVVVPPPPFVPASVPGSTPPPVPAPPVTAPARPAVPPNAPPYPGDPGVWGN